MNEVTSIPRFAVVGHPNKGKSSIVSTLSQDESVQISSIPGTTVTAREFPMQVGDRVLYVLIDTPGFQRARRALAWMQERETTASSRTAIVREFVESFKNTEEFPDECELLSPLLDGAGILYVVDGSEPYGVEYEAEMEILRWTGQPSLAVINMIGSENYVEQWRSALGQYFRIVREFNALYADFEKRLNLLRGFGELNEDWREPLALAVDVIVEDRERRSERSAEAISNMLFDMLNLTVQKRFSSDVVPNDVKEGLLDKFKQKLAQRELSARSDIEAIYDYHRLEREEKSTELVDDDLFSKDTWLLWGLNKNQLITTGAVSGAAVGAGVDLAVGGADFFLGTLVGGVIGGASAIYTGDKLANIDVLGLPLGGSEFTVGPTKNLNFPHILLGRAIYHHALVESRSHARRDVLRIESSKEKFTPKFIEDKDRNSVEKIFSRIRRQRTDAETVKELAEIVHNLIRSTRVTLTAETEA